MRGFLFKGGEYLENTGRITTVVFDKTGTITVGKPVVTGVQSIDNNRTLQLAASVENYSEHPIAKAVTDYFEGELLDVENVQTISGQGIKGRIGDKNILVGSKKFVESEADVSKVIENDAVSNLYVVYDKEYLGLISVSDDIKPTTKNAIGALKRVWC